MACATDPRECGNAAPPVASSFRVVKNHSQRVPIPAAHTADAMPQIDSIHAARSLYGTIVDRENHCVPLLQRHDFGAGLHPGSLLGHDELTSGEITARLR